MTFKCWTFQLTLRPQAGLHFPLGWNHQQPWVILWTRIISVGSPSLWTKPSPHRVGTLGLAFLHSSSFFPPSPRQLRILPQILGHGDLGLPSFFWSLRKKGKVVFNSSDPEQGTDPAQEVAQNLFGLFPAFCLFLSVGIHQKRPLELLSRWILCSHDPSAGALGRERQERHATAQICPNLCNLEWDRWGKDVATDCKTRPEQQ